ncbi:MAG: hypothetical protein PHD01_06510, partial [Geobacteraceae bacterium]|nr:hypothetical protein [Geobacteraceae bacterium]
ANPGKPQETERLIVDEGQRPCPERLDSCLGKMGPYTLHHPAGKILFDPLGRSGKHRSHPLRLELEAMVSVVVPGPKALYKLPGTDRRGGTNHRNQFPAPPYLDPKDAETGLLTMKGNPFHGAGKMFQVAGVVILHDANCIIYAPYCKSPFFRIPPPVPEQKTNKPCMPFPPHLL